jgi:hypothetical protein
MVREGRHLASLHPNIVVKVPCIAEGLKATKVLAAEGKRVNMTLIFSAPQALLAAKAGARYVSPFVGRLDDISAPGMELVADIIQIFDHYDYDCEVLAASLRHPMHVVEAARMGADIGTMPMSVFTHARQAPAHRQRPQALPRGLGEGEGADGGEGGAVGAADADLRVRLPRLRGTIREAGEALRGAVACPSCASADVEKQLSVFAVASAAPSPAFAGAGRGHARPRPAGATPPLRRRRLPCSS